MALVGSPQIANALNLTKRRVEQLVHEGLPREERGKYDLGKCMLWYIRYLQTALEKKGVAGLTDGEGAAQIKVERARLLKADASLREIELATKRGQVIEIEFAGKLWDDATIRARARLLGSINKNAPQLVGIKNVAQAMDLLTSIAHEALAELVALGDDVDIESAESESG